MSAISGFINTIRNAVYGEQVRGAIISALEQCYSDVNAPSLQTEAFETALNEAYAGGILDIQTVTSFSAMTNQKIIYRYNGTAAGKQKGLYYFSALSDSWVLIGSEIQKVSLLSQMTDTNDIYKYIGTEAGMVQNSLYCYNGTDWVPIGSGVLTASTAALMTNTGAIYKYTGSETGMLPNALYYYNGTEWVTIASNVQTTADFTKEGVPADAAAVGAELADLDERIEYIAETAGSGLSSTAINLLDTILKAAVYSIDQKSNIIALKTALQSGGGGAGSLYVVNTLTGYENSNTARRTDVGSAYVGTLSLKKFFGSPSSITITMNGIDVTSEVYDDATGIISISYVTGNILIQATATQTTTLDSVAYNSKTYRQIFETANLISDGDFESDSSLPINSGSPVKTTEKYQSKTHSMKCFGSTGANVRFVLSDPITAPTVFYFAVRVYCVRYGSGKVGALMWPANRYVEVNRVTEGWETASTKTNYNVDPINNVIVGTMGGGNADAYFDDAVIFDVAETLGDATISESTIDALYSDYVYLRGL